MPRVIIVGGGISGLATAWYLRKAGVASTIVESRPRLGGVIRTERIEGCTVEAGPDSFLSAKPAAMELIRDLGLAGDVIGSNDHLRVTYIRKAGRLVPLPDGLTMMVPTKLMPLVATRLLSWRAKLRMGMEYLLPPKAKPGDQSVAEFVREHYGAEAVDYLAEPLLAGVYGGDPEELSARAVLPRFTELADRYGSLTRGVLANRSQSSGTPLFQTLKGGLQQMVDALSAHTEVRHGRAEAVERGRVRVAGEWIEADHIVLACEAHNAAALLGGSLAELLAGVGYTSSTIFVLGYDMTPPPGSGFGFLVPKRERRSVVACTWVGTKFAHRVPEGKTVARCFVTGDATVEMVASELQEIAGFRAQPVWTRVFRWPQSMAQYRVGHGDRMAEVRALIAQQPGLHLAGNAYEGIGIPDCIRMGKAAADRILLMKNRQTASLRSRLSNTGRGLLAILCGAAVSLAADWKPAESPLTTPWTGNVTAERALPEYPRPQMVRAKWTNLNGLWDFAIRPKEEKQPAKFEGKLLVPFAVESALSGVKRPVTPGQRLWYRRTFTAGSSRGTRMLLHFDAVDWRAEVFVNGKAVGTHEGGYDPFTFDITAALKPGSQQQELVVAVWDPTDTGLQPRGKQVLAPTGIWYTAVTGIWQTVWLEPVPAARINELSMTPDVAGRRLRLTVRSEPAGEFTATAKLRGRNAGRISGKTNTEASLPLAELALWSPETPELYDLEVSLKTGDSVQSYFGMRKVEMRKDAAGVNRVFLNDRPYFLIGPLDQGWWPDGLYTAPTDEALKFDIEAMKKMGFNMARKHVKVEPARWYYWCDKLGFLVWQDMPSAMTSAIPSNVRKGTAADVVFPAEHAAGFEREMRALLKNLGNAPSIMAWIPYNEGWGQHATNDVLRLVKSLDPARLVGGPSGWEDRGYGDFKDMHEYPGPNMFPVVPDRISVLGEFGGLGLPLADHLWWDKRNWGYRTFDDRAKMQAAYDSLIEKLEPLVKQGLAAAIYTQTTDVEGEVNGLMTYDRKVMKFDVARLAAMHQRVAGLVTR